MPSVETARERDESRRGRGRERVRDFAAKVPIALFGVCAGTASQVSFFLSFSFLFFFFFFFLFFSFFFFSFLFYCIFHFSFLFFFITL